jgi:hypothetical protein
VRCACGYGPEWHPGAPELGHCPLCACGKLPGEHLPVAIVPSPLLTFDTSGNPVTWDGRQLLVCPGKPLTAAGKLPTLRRGSYREAPPSPRYATRPGWGPIMFPVVDEPEQVDEAPAGPPQVPARYTQALDEIARQAMPVGMAAAALGWQVDPWYYRAADGTETSVLVMRRGDLRAAAQWDRAPGATWRTAGALCVPPGSWPVKVGVKRLVEIITELG